jgi:hypothetical protein
MAWIDAILEGDRRVHKKQRHTARRIFERLRDERGWARDGSAAGSRKFTLAVVTAWIKLVEEDTSVALFGHAGGRLRLTDPGQAVASASLMRNGTAIWEASSSWNKTNSESNRSLKKIAPITDRVFRKCAKRSSPTPTKKSGAALASSLASLRRDAHKNAARYSAFWDAVLL